MWHIFKLLFLTPSLGSVRRARGSTGRSGDRGGRRHGGLPGSQRSRQRRSFSIVVGTGRSVVGAAAWGAAEKHRVRSGSPSEQLYAHADFVALCGTSVVIADCALTLADLSARALQLYCGSAWFRQISFSRQSNTWRNVLYVSWTARPN